MKIAIIIIVSMVVAAGIAVPIAMKFSTHGDPKAEVTAVRVEAAARGDLSEIVTAPGDVEPKTKVQISAKVVARIISMPFEEGQTVTRGNPDTKPPMPASVLVVLDGKDLEAQLHAAMARFAAQEAQEKVAEARLASQEAQLRALKVQFVDAERDLKRQKELLASKDVSQSTVDQAQAKVDELSARVEADVKSIEAEHANLEVMTHTLEAAEADVAQARDNLGYTTITSPIDGIITRLNAKVGEMVVMGTMNNAGTVIMEISDLSEMQVDAQVDESNIGAVKAGQKAKVRIAAYPDDEFDGTVKLVGLDTAQDRGAGAGGGGGGFGASSAKWYRARIVVDTKGKRVPAGLTADVDIATNVHKNVIKVPTQAVLGRTVDELPESVRTRPEIDKSKTLTTVVYRYEDGKAVITPVTIGASDMTHTVIESGLKEGERIIVGPYKALPALADGQKVTDEKATTQPTTQPATKPTK